MVRNLERIRYLDWVFVGTLSIGGVETHVIFDTGGTHSFVSPELIGKGLFQIGTGDDP